MDEEDELLNLDSTAAVKDEDGPNIEITDQSKNVKKKAKMQESGQGAICQDDSEKADIDMKNESSIEAFRSPDVRKRAVSRQREIDQMKIKQQLLKIEMEKLQI